MVSCVTLGLSVHILDIFVTLDKCFPLPIPGWHFGVTVADFTMEHFASAVLVEFSSVPLDASSFGKLCCCSFWLRLLSTAPCQSF